MEKKVKKTTAKKSAPKKAAPKQAFGRTGSGNGPFYVIVIIILITIIVLLINKFYEEGKFKPGFIKLPVENASKDPIRSSKKIPAEDDNKNVNNIASKIEDRNGDKNEDKKVEDKKVDDKKAKDTVAIDRDVLLYFLQFNEKTEKVDLKTVKRKLSDKQILSQTLGQLISGPSPSEEGKGYITAVPSHLKVRSVTITGKTAEIDFNSAIEDGAAGDILRKRIQQIVYTATQFEEIDSIIIKIDGQKRKSIGGGDGLSISGPLTRNLWR